MPANTATFEQELERVQSIGCPCCKSKAPFQQTWEADKSLPEFISCSECEFAIWEDGDWAPELYRIGI